MAFPNAGEPLLPGQEKALSTYKAGILGAIAFTADGRRFRYALNGATSIGGGQFVQASSAFDNGALAVNLAFATARTSGNTLASGVTTIPMTAHTTPIPASYFVDGYVQVDTGPDAGLYMIKKQGYVSSAAGTFSIELYGDDKLRTAWTTATRFGLRRNPYSGVVITVANGAITGLPLGVTPTEVPANTYFWLQDDGVASLNVDTTSPLVGGPMGFATGTTAGHAIAWTTNEAANYSDKAVVARWAGIGTADKAAFVKLDL